MVVTYQLTDRELIWKKDSFDVYYGCDVCASCNFPEDYEHLSTILNDVDFTKRTTILKIFLALHGVDTRQEESCKLCILKGTWDVCS